jgi:hypothetical protein
MNLQFSLSLLHTYTHTYTRGGEREREREYIRHCTPIVHLVGKREQLKKLQLDTFQDFVG